MSDDDEWVIARFPGGGTLTVTDVEIRRIGTTPNGTGERGIPGGLKYHHPGAGDQPSLEMGIEVRDGVPVCTEIRLVASDSGQVRVKDLRMIAGTLEDRIERLAAMAVFDRDPGVGWWGQGNPAYQEDRDRAQRSRKKSVQTARKDARRKVGPELLASAADLYRAARGNRLKAIQDGLGVSERTAARYVSAAREAGLLDG